MTSPTIRPEHVIELTVREEWGRLLASLIASIGDIQLAEDVLQDAITEALTNWKKNGLPKSPAAWLLTSARNRAIDRFRRNKRFSQLQPQITYLQELENLDSNEPDAMQAIPDKRLELMFTCCHPALDSKSQIALTLRTIGGLSVNEIAAAFLDKPDALAKRLTRAKNKIAVAGIPYSIPETAQLNERITTILGVIYLIFNEGYSASAGESLIRQELSDEAIRIARIAFQLLPEHCETGGLLALMLLHDSRRVARQTTAGELISLENQDRSLWNQTRGAEGRKLIKQLLPRGQIGSYQLQASISALHTEAASWIDTDWPQIVALYHVLYGINPTPVVKLNQAVAMSYTHDTDSALKILHELKEQPAMANYQPYFAASADILERSGDTASAQEALVKAIALTDNDAERKYLEKKRILN